MHILHWFLLLLWTLKCSFVPYVSMIQRTWHLAVDIRFNFYIIIIIFPEKRGSESSLFIIYLFLQTCCGCGQDLDSCPICRTSIQTRIRLYWWWLPVSVSQKLALSLWNFTRLLLILYPRFWSVHKWFLVFCFGCSHVVIKFYFLCCSWFSLIFL